MPIPTVWQIWRLIPKPTSPSKQFICKETLEGWLTHLIKTGPGAKTQQHCFSAIMNPR